MIKKKILAAGVDKIDIERKGENVRVNVKATKPGLIIGRGGKGIEDLRNMLDKMLQRLRQANGITQKLGLNLNIEELKRTEVSANAIAQQIAFDIERRMPFRTVMKHHLENIKQNREAQGGKIRISGRLNGAEISRTEWLAYGRMPLQTLRANIDYGEATSFNTYGTIGVKVWIYKGQIFDERKVEKK